MMPKDKIAFQGEKGAYSHLACEEIFPGASIKTCSTFEETFKTAHDDDNYKKNFHLWDDKKGYQVIPYKPYAYVKHSNGTHVSLYGDRLKKVFDYDKEDPHLFESDVPPTTRFLVDQYSDSDDASEGHRMIFIDIEVEVTDGFPAVSYTHLTLTTNREV